MKISVVIPCYQCAAFVRTAAESVLHQSHSDLELICVDDGSTDDTAEVLESLRPIIESKMAFHLVRQDNSGANVARNTGLGIASGDYVQFLDADDSLLPDKIASQVVLALKNANPAIIVGGYTRVNQHGTELLTRSYREGDAERLWELLLRTNLGITSSNLFRTTALREVGGWDPAMKSSQEYDLMFRIIQKGENVVFDPSILTRILDRESGSISRSNQEANARRYVMLRIRMREFLARKGDTVNARIAGLVLFDAIRTLYRHNPSEAIDFLKSQFPESFRPTGGEGSGRLYAALYRWFGFRFTENLFRLLGR